MTRRTLTPGISLRRWLPLAVALALTATALAAPHHARAGEFTISACQANGEFSSGAFENFATRGMKWRRACNPLGPGLRGLVTANVASSGHVAVGAQSAFVLSAPPGTTFSRLRWSGYAHRRDCRYALQVYAVRPEGSSVAIKNVRADHSCPRADEAQASSWPRPRDYELGGATRIVQRVACVGAASAQFCSAKGQNFLQTFTAEATVIDNTPPSVSIVPSGSLARGEWVSGPQDVSYEAADNVGVKAAQAWVGSYLSEGGARPCDYAQRIPCPNGPGQVEVETQHLPEGSQSMHVSAQDAAGNGGESTPVTVRIDNAAPGAVPVGVEGGENWRNRDEFNLAWANPPEGDRAPIVAARYRLCRVDGGECTTGIHSGTSTSQIDGLTVPAPGEWEVRMWREDAAGNQQPENASLPVKLLFDPEPPKLGFEDISPSDPTRISVQASDSISGLGGGEIELSRSGSGTWQVLPTTQEGESHLVARIDDATLPAGEYELRASAYDKAGNEATTSQRLDGQPMRVMLPLRATTLVTAGILEKRKVHRIVHRGGKPHKRTHTVSVLEPQEKVSFGRQVRFAGKLTDGPGDPVAGAAVQVYSRLPEEAEAMVASLMTGAQGGFAYAEKAKASSSLRFVYAGTATSLSAEAPVNLLVHGRSTISVNKADVLNGQSVVFSGRVQGRPLPEAGKLIELQVRLSHEWSTFRTIRSDSAGAWRIPYRFQRTCGEERFLFRVHVPGEAGYPLESGHSPQLTVRVRGQRCSTG